MIVHPRRTAALIFTGKPSAVASSMAANTRLESKTESIHLTGRLRRQRIHRYIESIQTGIPQRRRMFYLNASRWS